VSDVFISIDELMALGASATRLIEPIQAAGISIYLAGSSVDFVTKDARMASIAGQPLLMLGRMSPSAGGVARRFFDVAVAAGLLFVYLVPALAVGVLLWAARRRQRWVRRRAEWSAEGWGGEWLRRLSLDRCPGLLEILAGRMTLVGTFQHRPGVFGLAEGARPGTDPRIPAPQTLHRGYSLGWSAERDLKVVLRTVLARLSGTLNPEGGSPGGQPQKESSIGASIT
jgi:lipopolysaccharide/colanic/teichoic acid biosynthesis glycosyltransferase